MKKAELPAGMTSHALRHHYASVLLAAGESVVAVAERLGHENATLVRASNGTPRGAGRTGTPQLAEVGFLSLRELIVLRKDMTAARMRSRSVGRGIERSASARAVAAA